jgi:hypothetical protein
MLNQKFPGGFAQPEIDMAFARLSLAGGQPADAAAHARAAMKAFTSSGREGDRLQAAALVVRALISSGNVEQASEVLGQIPSPEGKGFPVPAVVHFRIARCLVLANTGGRAEAVRSMNAITAEMARLGLTTLEREARLAKEAVVKASHIDSTMKLTSTLPSRAR